MAQQETPDRSYVLISPCRNEADYMKNTLDTVIGQSILPKRWVIVDDGSTDGTPGIIAEYMARYPWITSVTVKDRGHRAVGPGVIEAFYAGYQTIQAEDYRYLCKLDLDLRLPPSYFESLITRMEADPLLATCSGKAYIHQDGRLVYERHGDDMSIGATKFYRTEHFIRMGGFIRQVMWDGIDCHRCRMLGLKARSWDEDDIRFIHLRPMGTSHKGVLTGRMRHGYGQYFMGTGFFFMLASSLFRMNQKPYVVGSLAILWGWIVSAWKKKPRYEEPGFRKFLRSYQARILLCGKRRGLDAMDRSATGAARSR